MNFYRNFTFLILVSLFLFSGCNKEVADEFTPAPPQEALENYLQAVKDKESDIAYHLIEESTRPDKEEFDADIHNTTLNAFEIKNSEGIDSNTYKFITSVNVYEDIDTEIEFKVVYSNDSWLISLNPDEQM